MKVAYTDISFRRATELFIDKLNDIIGEYLRQGFVLTVRQLYYQLVARGMIPNTVQEYKRVANIINDAKMAGLIDWDAIEDRTRDFVRRTRWDDGPHILKACISSYHQDFWVNQSHRVFVIVEKEALVGVLSKVCEDYDVPLLAARGYPSGTVLREFAIEDLSDAMKCGQTPIVLHLGDHDPSGIDMSRDLQERLSLFCREEITLERIALNMDQVRQLRPPENPAKNTDTRFGDYERRFGKKSWELDALPPAYLVDLISNHVERYIDAPESWQAVQEEITATKAKIGRVAKTWEKLK